MSVRHVDLLARDFTIRLSRGPSSEQVRLEVVRKGEDGKEESLANYRISVNDLSLVVRGGTYQMNGLEGYLLVRTTNEGAWFLLENAPRGFSGSCLIASHRLREAWSRLDRFEKNEGAPA